MATLESLLTPKAGDPDLPQLRSFLKGEMTEVRALIMRAAGNDAAVRKADPADDTQLRTQEALLARYNDLERRLKALPADDKPAPLRVNGVKP